ncbi:hypothetical protein AB205_0177900, partial [Aquarana catesbeiana]
DKLFVPAQLSSAKFSHHLSAVIDSGAPSNFIDRDLAHRLQIPVTKLPIYNSCVASTSHVPLLQSYSDPDHNNASKCDSSLHNHVLLYDSVIAKDADKSIEFSTGHLFCQLPQPESSPPIGQTYPLSRSLEPCLETSSKSSEVKPPGLPLSLPVAKLPWTHSQANLSGSSTVATPYNAIQVVATLGDAI